MDSLLLELEDDGLISRHKLITGPEKDCARFSFEPIISSNVGYTSFLSEVLSQPVQQKKYQGFIDFKVDDDCTVTLDKA